MIKDMKYTLPHPQPKGAERISFLQRCFTHGLADLFYRGENRFEVDGVLLVINEEDFANARKLGFEPDLSLFMKNS